MSEAVIVAIVTGSFSLIGTVLALITTAKKTDENIRLSQAKTDENIKISQAVTDTKIEELTREVRQHNNFAQRMPVVEEQIKVINHRISDLENEKK